MGRVLTIDARGVVNARALYEAARGTFDIPALEDLHNKEALERFLEKWEGDPNFRGPLVLFDERGACRAIITEASQRLIRLYGTHPSLPGRVECVTLDFGRNGSANAASEIVARLREAGTNAAIECDDGEWYTPTTYTN